jgi:dihydroorotase
MTRLLIQGGRLIDPANGFDAVADVLIEDGRIVDVGPDLASRASTGSARTDQLTIDAKGLVVAPGLIDLHTHLREPGFEYKEDIESGTRAAARGGFTTVCAMPNTEPTMDSRATVEYVLRRAAEVGAVRVLPIGAVTKGRAGKLLAELGELADAGCIGFSDDGNPVADAAIMRRALEYASTFGLPIIDHCEDPQLAGGVMHEGWVSTRLGLKGIPAASEENMVSRDIALARQTGAHVHIAHLSTAGAVELVRRAKAEGVRVTAEVTPHHLALDHEAVMHAEGSVGLAYDTNAKMYPPLRSAADVVACIEGVKDGTIDAIATDHAPHAVQEKPAVRRGGERNDRTGDGTVAVVEHGRQRRARCGGADQRAGAGAGAGAPGAGHRHAVGRRAGGRGRVRPGARVDGGARGAGLERQEHTAAGSDAARAGGGSVAGEVVHALEGGRLTSIAMADVQARRRRSRRRWWRRDSRVQWGLRRTVPSQMPAHATRVPDIRKTASEWRRTHRGVPADEVLALCEAPWATDWREERIVAITLIEGSKELLGAVKWPQMERWSRDLENWEHVDWLAGVTGRMLIADRTLLNEVKALESSENPWQRRLALVTLIVAFMKGGVFRDELSSMAERRQKDPHPLERRAVVWARDRLKKDHLDG